METEAKRLGAILNDMYENAPRGRQVTMIHLFGIQYSEDIERVGVKDVVTASGIKSTYITEVNKGMNLAEYVVPVQK